jgi:hypothetical protein
LRPVLPAYLPDGFDRTAHLFDDDDKIRTIVLFGPLDSTARNPHPAELEIVRWGPDPSLEPTPYAPCEDLDDAQECANLRGREAGPASLTRWTDDYIAYHVEFPLGDSVVSVSAHWSVDEGTKGQLEEILRNEVLEIAESVVEP